MEESATNEWRLIDRRPNFCVYEFGGRLLISPDLSDETPSLSYCIDGLQKIKEGKINYEFSYQAWVAVQWSYSMSKSFQDMISNLNSFTPPKPKTGWYTKVAEWFK